MIEYFFLFPLGIALVLGVMSPGPSFLVVAQTAASKSRADGIATSFGMGVGAAIFALIASLGLYAVLESVPWVYLALKITGGTYLCFLAYKIWKNADSPFEKSVDNKSVKSGIYRSFWTGLITQLSNPKTAIAFVGIFAAFLPREVPEYSYLLITILAFIIDTLWYSLVSILLSTEKAQETYAKYKQYICRVSGSFMGFMGLKLATNS